MNHLIAAIMGKTVCFPALLRIVVMATVPAKVIAVIVLLSR
jgi:hypothetical protein